MTSREPRVSEQILDTIYKYIRNIDKLVWDGDPESLRDIEENAVRVQMKLDEMLKQLRIESNYANPTVPNQLGKNIPTFLEQKPPTKEWHCTPIVTPTNTNNNQNER